MMRQKYGKCVTCVNYHEPDTAYADAICDDCNPQTWRNYYVHFDTTGCEPEKDKCRDCLEPGVPLTLGCERLKIGVTQTKYFSC